MITLVLTVEEDNINDVLDTNGTVVGLKPNLREEEMMGGVLSAIEKYCVKERMPLSGGKFVRTEWPMVKETTNGNGNGESD